MRFPEIFSSGKPVISFEFFPPKDQSLLPQTFQLIEQLRALDPDFMTVTYGAGGGTRMLTTQMVSFIHEQLSMTSVAHLTCVGHTSSEIDSMVGALEQSGIENVLALRGDPPKGSDRFETVPGGFGNARDLTRHLKQHHSLSIGVAGYPETHVDAASPDADIAFLKEKVDAGADVVITQLFFSASMYFSFVERARAGGITVPIVPGVMPIGNVKQIRRFTSMCGASIPPTLSERLREIESDIEAVVRFGIDYAVELS
ncbi:MAG: methylenetetrahydrofolate reductase, partial [Bdellovibrionales bacterium]|nr:methylenetetrahydrofolate reductase [Bdellovibrionales bacterium]